MPIRRKSANDLRRTQKTAVIRPRATRDQRFGMRISEGEWARWMQAAQMMNADDLSSWMRRLANDECDRRKIPR